MTLGQWKPVRVDGDWLIARSNPTEKGGVEFLRGTYNLLARFNAGRDAQWFADDLNGDTMPETA